MAQQIPLVLINGRIQRLPGGDTVAGASGGSGLIYTAIKTANYTADVNEIVRVDSTAGTFTVTLPATPADGSVVGVFDVSNKCAINAVLVAPSGGTVESDAVGLSVNISGAYVPLVYNSASTNWKISDTFSNGYSEQVDIISPFLLMGA